MKNLVELYADARVNAFNKSVGIGTTRVLSRSRNRIAVHFYWSAVDYFVGPGDQTSSEAFAAKVTTGQDQHFTLQEHGDLPTNDWSVTAGGAAVVHVVEVLANCPCGTGHDAG